MAGAAAQGTIYLLHYTKPTSRGRQHYLGWAKDPLRRLRRHRAGYGATDTRIAVAEGAGLVMAQTWSGTPSLERRIKEWRRARRAGFAGICPLCDGRDPWPPELAAALGAGSMTRVVSAPAS
jgi:predicted GIY-YIG superfamily endonuclease